MKAALHEFAALVKLGRGGIDVDSYNSILFIITINTLIEKGSQFIIFLWIPHP